MMIDLATEFPAVANTIGFKNRLYHHIFSNKLIVVYNQLPSVSSLINLATLHSNQISYGHIELAYGDRADLTAKGYHTLIASSN